MPPRKRTTKARATVNTMVALPNGALQTTFAVEGEDFSRQLDAVSPDTPTPGRSSPGPQFQFIESRHKKFTSMSAVINPTMKLNWFLTHAPHQMQRAKNLLLTELRVYHATTLEHDTVTDESTSDASWADAILGMSMFCQPVAQHSVEAEVDAYLLDSEIGTSSLSYWQANQSRYPTLFAPAMDVLPIQGSAVPCERVFSSAKETITMRRNRISHQTMEALQILKFSFRHGHGLNFTAWMDKNTEIREIEQLMDEELLVPNEISAFIDSLLVEDHFDDVA